MATQVQLRRGNTTSTSTFTGAVAEVTIDTDKKTIVVHDGSTAGGTPLAKENSLTAIFVQANSAFDKANSANVLAQSAYDKANSANILAQTSFDASNSASSYANSAFDKANSANTLAQSAYDKANSANVLAQTAFDASNSASSYANSAFNVANGAAFIANTDYTTISATSGVYANSITIPEITLAANGRISNITNTAIRSATTSQTGIVQLEDSTTSTSTTTAATPNSVKSAYDLANGKFSSSGGTISGDVTVSGNLTIVGQQVYANTQTVLIKDNIVTLNAAIDQTSAPVSNAGIEIDRGSSANVYLLWNETSDTWQYTNDGSAYFNIADAGRVDAAFSLANGTAGIANTDYTTLSASAGTYGNGTFVPVITLSANGRVTSVTNTAITSSGASIGDVLALSIALG